MTFNKVHLEKLKIKLKSNLKKISTLSDVIPHLGRGKLVTYSAIGTKLINSFLEASNENWHKMFLNMGLNQIEINNKGLVGYLYTIVSNTNKPNFIEKKGNILISYFENIDGLNIAFWVNTQAQWWEKSECLYVSSDVDHNKVKENLGRRIWQHLDSNNIEVSSSAKNLLSTIKEFNIISLKNISGMQSEIADNIYNNINKFIKAGKTRSIMLYGEPGTGKSEAIKRIMELGKFFTIRFSTKTLSSFQFDLKEIIDWLRPDAIVIDDFDRVINAENLLSDIEYIKEKVKLLIVSINDISKFDKAIFRPGRFDDILEFKDMDSNIKLDLIGEEISEEFRNRLLELPIAYIKEFNERKTILGIEAALECIEELENRSKQIPKNDKS